MILSFPIWVYVGMKWQGKDIIWGGIYDNDFSVGGGGIRGFYGGGDIRSIGARAVMLPE